MRPWLVIERLNCVIEDLVHLMNFSDTSRE